MVEWARFELGGCTFTASLPDGAADAQVFTIRVLRGDAEIRHETVPLLHPPIFGPDAEDVRALHERSKEIIRELRLE